MHSEIIAVTLNNWILKQLNSNFNKHPGGRMYALLFVEKVVIKDTFLEPNEQSL